MWWLIWSLIIAGTVVGAVFLVRRYMRAGRAFMKQMEETTLMISRFDSLVNELNAAQHRAEGNGFSPHLVASADQKQQWRKRREHIKASRDGRRETRMDRTVARWREIGIPL